MLFGHEVSNHSDKKCAGQIQTTLEVSQTPWDYSHCVSIPALGTRRPEVVRTCPDKVVFIQIILKWTLSHGVHSREICRKSQWEVFKHSVPLKK
jgi:hypothetical protein